MADQPSPVQGGISNEVTMQGTHTTNSVMQVECVGELMDTVSEEELDRGLMLRQLFGDDMDHMAEQHWQELGQLVVSRHWQYGVVTATVTLLTGEGNSVSGDEWRAAVEEELLLKWESALFSLIQ